MKRPLFLAIGFVAATIGGVVGKDIARQFLRPKQDLKSAQFLTAVANEINKKLPVRVDAETELVSTHGIGGVFVYKYRLHGRAVARLKSEESAEALRANIKSMACKKPETRDTFLKNGITLRYGYFDQSEHKISEFDVAPAECGF